MQDKYLNKHEASQYVNLSVRFIDYAVARRELVALKFGKLVRFRRTDLDAWAESHLVKSEAA